MADTVFTIPNERLHCTLKGFTASVNQDWLVIIWGGIKGAVVVICASLFTIKKGEGKSIGGFHWGFNKGAPVCSGIPALEK